MNFSFFKKYYHRLLFLFIVTGLPIIIVAVIRDVWTTYILVLTFLIIAKKGVFNINRNLKYNDFSNNKINFRNILIEIEKIENEIRMLEMEQNEAKYNLDQFKNKDKFEELKKMIIQKLSTINFMLNEIKLEQRKKISFRKKIMIFIIYFLKRFGFIQESLKNK